MFLISESSAVIGMCTLPFVELVKHKPFGKFSRVQVGSVQLGAFCQAGTPLSRSPVIGI